MSRRSRRLRAWVALAAFLGTLAVPLANARHTFRLDDAACALGVGASDLTAARVVAPATSDTSEHCALCHWLRAVGGSQPTGLSTVIVWLQPLEFASAAATRDLASPVLLERPARAPPAVL